VCSGSPEKLRDIKERNRVKCAAVHPKNCATIKQAQSGEVCSGSPEKLRDNQRIWSMF
jgi:hypothetical protein